VGCEYGLMAESGRELGTSSEKVEEIALVAVDGLFAMIYNTMFDCRFRGSQLWCLSAIGGGRQTQRVQGGFQRSTGPIVSM
jgi:hypothetical protein